MKKSTSLSEGTKSGVSSKSKILFTTDGCDTPLDTQLLGPNQLSWLGLERSPSVVDSYPLLETGVDRKLAHPRGRQIQAKLAEMLKMYPHSAHRHCSPLTRAHMLAAVLSNGPQKSLNTTSRTRSFRTNTTAAPPPSVTGSLPLRRRRRQSAESCIDVVRDQRSPARQAFASSL